MQLTTRTQHNAGAIARPLHRLLARTIKIQRRERKLIDGHWIGNFICRCGLSKVGFPNAGVRQRRKVEYPHQFWNVHVFGGQPTAENIVRVGHNFNAQTMHIGMQLASIKIDGFTRFQVDFVQKERPEDTRIPRVAFIQQQDIVQGVGNPVHGVGARNIGACGDSHGVDKFGAVDNWNGDPRGEQGADAAVLIVYIQHGDVAVEFGAVQRCSNLKSAREGPEACHGLEIGEGDDQLGLVVVILVVTLRGIKTDARSVFPRKPFLGLRAGGVRLQGQGLTGGEDFQEERQGVAKLSTHPSSKMVLRVCSNCLVKGLSVLRFTPVKGGGITGVGTVPELSFRAIRGAGVPP